MPDKRNNDNGAAQQAPETVTSFMRAMQAPAANSFVMSQRLALEAARFWARRMRAYADQMEALACCSTPEEFAETQKRFVDRWRDDYAAESEELSKLLSAQPARNNARTRRKPAAEDRA